MKALISHSSLCSRRNSFKKKKSATILLSVSFSQKGHAYIWRTKTTPAKTSSVCCVSSGLVSAEAGGVFDSKKKKLILFQSPDYFGKECSFLGIVQCMRSRASCVSNLCCFVSLLPLFCEGTARLFISIFMCIYSINAYRTMLGPRRKAVIGVFLLACILRQYYVASDSIQILASCWPIMDWMLGFFRSGAHDLYFLQREGWGSHSWILFVSFRCCCKYIVCFHISLFIFIFIFMVCILPRGILLLLNRDVR